MCVPTCFRSTVKENGPLFPEQLSRTPSSRSSDIVPTTRYVVIIVVVRKNMLPKSVLYSDTG